MRHLILAAFAGSLLGLGGAVAAMPAQAACRPVPGGLRCVHPPVAGHRVIVHRTIVHPAPPPVVIHKTIVHRAPASPPVVVHKTIVSHQ